MRHAAQEIATRWIGPRSAEQVRVSMQKELSAQRYTSLDAVIERHVDGERRLRLSGRGELAKDRLRRRVAARLQHLEHLGLAGRDRLGRWTVEAQLKPKLRDLAERNDIIKSLYAKLGPRSGAVAFYEGKELAGRVVGMRSHDELRDRRFLAIEDAHGRVLYVRPVNPHALRVLEEGSLVRLRPAQSQRQSENQERPVQRGYGIVEILSARSIQSQVEAEAWTWLDRQMYLRSLGKVTTVTSDPAPQQAAESRRRWMAEHGYAQLQDGRYQLRPDAQQSLRAREWQAVEPTLRRRFGNQILPLPPGGQIAGIYGGTVSLHAGLFAAVTGRGQTHLVPVRQVSRTNPGVPVIASVDANGRGKIVSATRQKKSREAERE
jgi:hypothetical protein